LRVVIEATSTAFFSPISGGRQGKKGRDETAFILTETL